MPEITNALQEKYLKSFLVNRDYLLPNLSEIAEKNHIPIIDKLTASFYVQLLQIKKPKNLLEIGTAIGYSAILAAQVLSDESKITTIEKSRDNIKLAKENLNKYDPSNKITLVEGEAKEILPNLAMKFDFIFLDADKHDYLLLLPMVLEKLQTGGILFCDNLLWKGEVALEDNKSSKTGIEIIRQFNLEFMNCSDLISSILPIGDGIGLGIKI